MEFKNIEQKSAAIVTLYKAGFNQREISKKINIPRSTVGDILRKFDRHGVMCRLPGSGRRESLNSDEVASILAIVYENPKTSALKIQSLIQMKHKKLVCLQTIRNYLNKNKYFGRVACKKPLISKKNIAIRFETAKIWAKWPLKKWNNILFTDESKFNVFNSDGRVMVWRKPGERLDLKNLVPTVKHGGKSVMVWGSISANGVGNLVFIEGILDSIEYVRILSENLDISVEKAGLGKDYIFMQDNDPKHKSKYTMEYLRENGVKLLEHPAQSPDLNPIENVWAYVEIELKKREIKNVRELKAAIVEIWNKIDKNFLKRLVSSMPKRISEVIRAKGGHINY